jgi:hypothetical protein
VFIIVGEEARASSRAIRLLVDMSESAMLRSVEREDCADSDGDFVCFVNEAWRRLWDAEPNLTWLAFV